MIKLHFTEEIDAAPAEGLVERVKADAMGGWAEWPEKFDREELKRIKAAADEIRATSKYLVCIGIGGSYLGHRAVINALRNNNSETKILYIGNSLDPLMVERTLKKLAGHDFSLCVISKSGTTTEPAIAFRIMKQKLEKKYGREAAARRIYVTTDAEKGTLHDEAVANGYTRFVVPNNIGGRYSVLTAVGLLPMAVAGVDVDALLTGAREAMTNGTLTEALRYACLRDRLRRQGYDVEVLASFTPLMSYFNQWWIQLFGESEGKGGQGIFPAAVIYTADLHSMGQYLQDGRRNVFETVMRFAQPARYSVVIPKTGDDADGLAYLEGKSLDYVNGKAQEATVRAHRAGGLPVLEVEVPDLSAHSLGQLIYFFEMGCAVSGMLAGVNPFDQPGVEAYKTEMFKLLGKPGYAEVGEGGAADGEK